jgi:C-terminal processing protease CtpA/Prc
MSTFNGFKIGFTDKDFKSLKHKMMKLKILFPLLFLIKFSFAQQVLTTEQVTRLADAGKVYGYIKYFHPFLQYKDIKWDSAFVVNVQGIIDAKSKEEYAAVMQRLFSSLDDNLTSVTSISPKDTLYKPQFTSYNIKDSILYINMNDLAPLVYGNPDNPFDKVEEALQNVEKTKGIIFDMRSPVNSTYLNNVQKGQFLDWISSYFKGDLLIPSSRSTGYFGLDRAYLKVSNLYSVHGIANKEVPLVFIGSNEEQIPLVATVLQQKGKAAIIQPEAKQLRPGNSVSFYIQDSLLVKVRSSEVLNQDGSLLLIQPNDTWSEDEPYSLAITKAEKLITDGFQKKIKFTQYAPMPVTRFYEYPDQKNYPSIGYRMLAAAKIFSIIDYFFANKVLMDKNWDLCYKEMIPKFIEAKDSLQYMKAVAELYANIKDSHGFISRPSDGFSLRLNPIIQSRGNFVPPVITRVIENRVMVTSIYNDSICRSIEIEKGDVILAINGEDAMKLVDEVRKYQCASTKASQTFYISSFVLFGNKGQIHKLKVAKANGQIKEVLMPTVEEFKGDWTPDDYVYRMFSYNEYPTIKMLYKEIGYADLTGKLMDSDNDSIVRMLKNVKAMIFDMRGYPHGNGINSFANILWKSKTKGGKFVTIVPSSDNFPNNPVNIEDSRTSTFQGSSNTYTGWVYTGKTIVLTNESAQSFAENVVGGLKAISDATIIGSPTAGAESGTLNFTIPGNIILWFSGSNSLLPNGKSFMRFGYQPDISVRPTIKGIQAGKDEVLERAIKYLKSGK